jgi:hypothetical protein
MILVWDHIGGGTRSVPPGTRPLSTKDSKSVVKSRFPCDSSVSPEGGNYVCYDAGNALQYSDS